MIGREVAHGIGRAGVTGERECLATAAAEIQLARGQLAHDSFIHAVPRKALKAGEFARMSASECPRTFQNVRPVIDSAA